MENRMKPSLMEDFKKKENTWIWNSKIRQCKLVSGKLRTAQFLLQIRGERLNNFLPNWIISHKSINTRRPRSDCNGESGGIVMSKVVPKREGRLSHHLLSNPRQHTNLRVKSCAAHNGKAEMDVISEYIADRRGWIKKKETDVVGNTSVWWKQWALCGKDKVSLALES